MANKWKLGRGYVAQETVFNEDPDPTGAAYSWIKFNDDLAFQPSADVVERTGLTGDFTRIPHEIAGKGGTITGKFELKGSGTPADDATPAVASEGSPILEALLGSVVRGNGTKVAAASGDGSVGNPLTVANAAGLSKGGAICVDGEIRFITAIAGTDVTLNKALSAVPAVDTVVYASSMFKRANSGHKSLAFVGIRDGVQYTFLGCAGTMKIESVNAKGIALVSVELMVASWTVTNKAALPAAKPSGVSAVRPPVVKGSPMFVDAASELSSSIDFDPGLQFAYQESTEAVDNKSDVALVGANPQGSFKPYFNAQHMTDFLAGTSKALGFACGDETNGWGLYMPNCQYMLPALEDRNGFVGENIPFAVNDNGTDPDYVLCVF